VSQLIYEGQDREENGSDTEPWMNTSRYKCLASLSDSQMFWTDDWRQWYLLTDNFFGKENGHEQVVGAVITLDVEPIHGAKDKTVEENTVHIRSIAVADEAKGVGLFGLICSSLIRAAEENGVFIWGTARYFECSIPQMFSSDDIVHWRESKLFEESFSYGRSWRKTVENTKRLHRTYLDYGFCRFEIGKERFQNKFFSDYGFGYCSCVLRDDELRGVLERKLAC